MNRKSIELTEGLAEPDKLLPPDILEILGPPALVGSESADVFYLMLSRFVVEFNPGTITEWLLVWDLVNLNWEIARYRRLKASLTNIESQGAREHLAKKLAGRAPLLGGGTFTSNDVANTAAIRNFKTMTQIETMLERLEIRRERLFRELQAHKAFSITTATAASERFVEESSVIEQ